jgi:hypothetical protein
MTSIAVQIAEGVRRELAHAPLTMEPVVGRTYDTTAKLKDAGTLHVDVIGAGWAVEAGSVGQIARNVRVQLVVRKRLDHPSREDDPTELDRLMLLVEQLEEFFFLRELDSVEAAWIAGDTVGPIDEDYRLWRQFTAVTTLTYRTFGDI